MISFFIGYYIFIFSWQCMRPTLFLLIIAHPHCPILQEDYYLNWGLSSIMNLFFIMSLRFSFLNLMMKNDASMPRLSQLQLGSFTISLSRLKSNLKWKMRSKILYHIKSVIYSNPEQWCSKTDLTKILLSFP
jgi:hypothetical protein